MKVQNNFFKYLQNPTIPSKNRKDTNSSLFPEIITNRNDKKNTYSFIRKNLLLIAKEDIKDSKELIIKSYKEDLDLEQLNTNHSLNIINSDNYNDDILELSNEEELDLKYTKKKYADKNCSSSNMSD